MPETGPHTHTPVFRFEGIYIDNDRCDTDTLCGLVIVSLPEKCNWPFASDYTLLAWTRRANEQDIVARSPLDIACGVGAFSASLYTKARFKKVGTKKVKKESRALFASLWTIPTAQLPVAREGPAFVGVGVMYAMQLPPTLARIRKHGTHVASNGVHWMRLTARPQNLVSEFVERLFPPGTLPTFRVDWGAIACPMNPNHGDVECPCDDCETSRDLDASLATCYECRSLYNLDKDWAKEKADAEKQAVIRKEVEEHAAIVQQFQQLSAMMDKLQQHFAMQQKKHAPIATPESESDAVPPQEKEKHVSESDQGCSATLATPEVQTPSESTAPTLAESLQMYGPEHRTCLVCGQEHAYHRSCARCGLWCHRGYLRLADPVPAHEHDHDWLCIDCDPASVVGAIQDSVYSQDTLYSNDDSDVQEKAKEKVEPTTQIVASVDTPVRDESQDFSLVVLTATNTRIYGKVYLREESLCVIAVFWVCNNTWMYKDILAGGNPRRKNLTLDWSVKLCSPINPNVHSYQAVAIPLHSLSRFYEILPMRNRYPNFIDVLRKKIPGIAISNYYGLARPKLDAERVRGAVERFPKHLLSGLRGKVPGIIITPNYYNERSHQTVDDSP